jgi:hypothetical protein
LQADVGAAEKQVAKLTDSLESSEAELKAYQEDVATLHRRQVSDVKNAEQQRKELVAECERLQRTLAQAESSLQTEAQRCVELATDLVAEQSAVATAKTLVREQCKQELAEQSEATNRRMTELQKVLERERHDHKATTVESENAHRQLATLSSRCDELEQKVIATSRIAAEQLAAAEETADKRVSEMEQLHVERHQLLQREMAARFATTKKVSQRSIEAMQQRYASDLRDAEKNAQVQLSAELESCEDKMNELRASTKIQIECVEVAALENATQCERWMKRTDAVILTHRQKYMQWRCWAAWGRYIHTSIAAAAASAASAASAVAERAAVTDQRKTLHRIVRIWSAETKLTVHRNLVVTRRCSLLSYQLLLSLFDQWRWFQCGLRKARCTKCRIDRFKLGKSFHRWAQATRIDNAVRHCQALADKNLAAAKVELEDASQRVSQLEQELLQNAQQSADYAAESDARADQRVHAVEESMGHRIEILRQESQARIVQIERAADVRYQQLVSSAKLDVENAEQMLAARSLESENTIAEVREETEAALRTMRAELMMEQRRLKQDRVDLKREAAEQLADLESVMSKRCVETERQAEHSVSKARAKAEENIRKEQQAIQQAWDHKLTALQQKHLSDMESVNHRAQEEIRQCRSDSDKKMRVVLSEAAQYQEELVIATDRADAAERQVVVRTNVSDLCCIACLDSVLVLKKRNHEMHNATMY